MDASLYLSDDDEDKRPCLILRRCSRLAIAGAGALSEECMTEVPLKMMPASPNLLETAAASPWSERKMMLEDSPYRYRRYPPLSYK